jgi:GT2 family glycosyltransferase
MKPLRADIVTVFHNETNYGQHKVLFDAIREHEPDGGYRLIGVDNRITNRGFAAGCNLGAFHPKATAPIIGFINPDAIVHGPFLDQVEATLRDPIVITGNRYGKPEIELREWGVRDWVCGACMFVNRAWYTSIGGMDEQFVWSHDDTDLVRTAESNGLYCASLTLPIRHDSPREDSPEDAAYKRHHFELAQRRYRKKWGT